MHHFRALRASEIPTFQAQCDAPGSAVRPGAVNGLDHDSVISCDNITTVPRAVIGRLVGYLRPAQEAALARAIVAAYDLDL
jgi:mRNA-degrading endonuclease toxin of MazEF toxin-antitoxin module